jgi:hypothetical protein
MRHLPVGLPIAAGRVRLPAVVAREATPRRRRDAHQPSPAQPRLRPSDAGPIARHANPERAGPDAALDRNGHGHGLAVDADRNLRGSRGDDDFSGGQHGRTGSVLAAEQARRLQGAGDLNGHHTEDAAVQPSPAAQPRQIPSSVGVVADEQRLRRRELHAVCLRLQPRTSLALQQRREHVQSGRELVVSVGGSVDNLGIGAEGGVVDEDPVADGPEVNLQLDAVGQRVQARGGVVTIETKVCGEVITSAGGDDKERDAVPGGNAGDQALGAVTAGHAEQVGAPSNCLFRHVSDVNRGAAIEQENRGAAGLGFRLQVELRDFAATGHRIHDQKRASQWSRVQALWHPPIWLTDSERCSRGCRGEQPQGG